MEALSVKGLCKEYPPFSLRMFPFRLSRVL